MNRHFLDENNRAMQWVIGCLGLLGILSCTIGASGVEAAMDAPATAAEGGLSKVEYLSDLLPDRMVSVTQDWGELGIDTATKATGQPAQKLRI